jgi:hypothetical protein
MQHDLTTTYRPYIPRFHHSYGHSDGDADSRVAIGLFAVLVLLYLVFLLWLSWRKRRRSN